MFDMLLISLQFTSFCFNSDFFSKATTVWFHGSNHFRIMVFEFSAKVFLCSSYSVNTEK